MLNVQKGMESSLQIKDCNLGKSMGSSYVVRISELIQVECPYICKGSDGKAAVEDSVFHSVFWGRLVPRDNTKKDFNG